MAHRHDDDQVKQSDRRNFLKLASIGTVVGGAALVVGAPAKAATKSPNKGAGYQKTEHVQTYYALAKF